MTRIMGAAPTAPTANPPPDTQLDAAIHAAMPLTHADQTVSERQVGGAGAVVTHEESQTRAGLAGRRDPNVSRLHACFTALVIASCAQRKRSCRQAASRSATLGHLHVNDWGRNAGGRCAQGLAEIDGVRLLHRTDNLAHVTDRVASDLARVVERPDRHAPRLPSRDASSS